jgi:hypothetical protein
MPINALFQKTVALVDATLSWLQSYQIDWGALFTMAAAVAIFFWSFEKVLQFLYSRDRK